MAVGSRLSGTSGELETRSSYLQIQTGSREGKQEVGQNCVISKPAPYDVLPGNNAAPPNSIPWFPHSQIVPPTGNQVFEHQSLCVCVWGGSFLTQTTTERTFAVR